MPSLRTDISTKYKYNESQNQSQQFLTTILNKLSHLIKKNTNLTNKKK